MTDRGETATGSDAVGEGLCSSVEMAQQRLSLSYKTVSYINYDLCFEWSWQWHMVTSLMTSLWSNNSEIIDQKDDVMMESVIL